MLAVRISSRETASTYLVKICLIVAPSAGCALEALGAGVAQLQSSLVAWASADITVHRTGDEAEIKPQLAIRADVVLDEQVLRPISCLRSLEHSAGKRPGDCLSSSETTTVDLV